jgi:hypothetical protein
VNTVENAYCTTAHLKVKHVLQGAERGGGGDAVQVCAIGNHGTAVLGISASTTESRLQIVLLLLLLLLLLLQ